MSPTRTFLSLLAAVAVTTLPSPVQAEPAKKAPPTPAPGKPAKKVYPLFGSIERLDPGLDKLIAPGAGIEKLAEGFKWAEGPVWDQRKGVLYFSDVPNNVVFRWQEGVGTKEHLFPSGYTGKAKRGGETGSNGLTIDAGGRLVLCQHGDRQIGRLEKDGKVSKLVGLYKWRRFNSPNDLVYRSNGDLYFTDPPYGLEKNNADPAKEIAFSGVYRLTPSGELSLLTSALTFPNGIAFSPDEKTLYVAVSDPAKPVIMSYQLKQGGGVDEGKVFFDASSLEAGRQGLPDGLKVDKAGNLWATGPGGVLIINPAGKHLGTINTGEPTANCAWGDNGTTLYITANKYLCRVKTLAKGTEFK